MKIIKRVDTAVVIQDNLKAIGINVEIKTYQWASYVAFVENPAQEKRNVLNGMEYS